MTHRLTPLVLAVSLLTAVPALADTMVFTSVKDNTLFESASGELSSGIGASMFVGRTSQGVDEIRRGLVAFNVSGIPAGSTVTSAVLILRMEFTGPAGLRAFTIHSVSESWGEGTSNSSIFGSGAPATPGDATWIHRSSPGSFWSAAGGTFVGAASASQNVDAVGTYSWGSTPMMVADVQGWINNPATNHGWLLKGDETASGTAKRFTTREAASNRPLLRVEYTPPAVPVEPSTWSRIKVLLTD